MTRAAPPSPRSLQLLNPLGVWPGWDLVKGYVDASIPTNTRAAYQGDWDRFAAWSTAEGITLRFPEEPAPVPLVAGYLATLARDGAAHASLRRYAASIGALHVQAGHPSPSTHPLVQRVLRGAARKHGSAQRQAQPLFPEDVRHFVSYAVPKLRRFQDVRAGALILLGWCGGFRASELVALRTTDLQEDERGLIVTVRRSKTDQGGKGRALRVPRSRDEDFCPVHWVGQWMELRTTLHQRASGSEHSQSSWLFPEMTGQVLQDTPCSTRAVDRLVKRLAQLCGRNPDAFSSHSLRAGLVSSAAAAGKSFAVVQAATGHRSAASVARYCRALQLRGEAAADGLL